MTTTQSTQLKLNFKLEPSYGPRIFRVWYPTPYNPGQKYLYIKDITHFSCSIEGTLLMWGRGGSTLIASINTSK